jgi:hypothetical protein
LIALVALIQKGASEVQLAPPWNPTCARQPRLFGFDAQ